MKSHPNLERFVQNTYDYNARGPLLKLIVKDVAGRLIKSLNKLPADIHIEKSDIIFILAEMTIPYTSSPIDLGASDFANGMMDVIAELETDDNLINLLTAYYADGGTNPQLQKFLGIGSSSGGRRRF